MSRGLLSGIVLAAAVALGACGVHHDARELVVGSRSDTESVLLAELYAAALRSYGAPAYVRDVADPIAGLDSGEVDVTAGFTGNLLRTFQPGAAAIAEQSVYRAMVAALPEGVGAGDYTPDAQDKPAAVVTSGTSAAWHSDELVGLVQRCGRLRMGSVDGVVPPTELGGCTLPTLLRFPSDTALFDALRAGRIDVAWTTTADPGVPDDLVTLADRRPALVPAENVVPLYRRNELSQQEVRALNEVAGEFDTAALTDMRRQLAHGADPRQLAEAWLASHPLGR